MSGLAFPRSALPVPNEILYEILSDLIIESLHARIMHEKSDSTLWNALVVLPHVSRSFRASSIRIYATVFSIRLGNCGDWLLERVHKKLKRFKPSRLPPQLPELIPIEESDLMFEMVLRVRGAYEKPQGVLRVYGSVIYSNYICRGALRLGFDLCAGTPGMLSDIVGRLMILCHDAMIWSMAARPAKLASLLSELVITHCAVDIITFMFWLHSNYVAEAQSLTEAESVGILTVALEVFESCETGLLSAIPEQIVAPHSTNKKILTRAVLEDSGVVLVLERLRGKNEDDPHGLIPRAAKLLKDWDPLLNPPNENHNEDARVDGSINAVGSVTQSVTE